MSGARTGDGRLVVSVLSEAVRLEREAAREGDESKWVRAAGLRRSCGQPESTIERARANAETLAEVRHG